MAGMSRLKAKARDVVHVAWTMWRETFHRWLEDHAASMGAALAYYTFFAMAPVLMLVIFVAGLVFGSDAAQGQLMQELSGLVGVDAAHSIQAVIASVNRPATSLLAALISTGVVLLGATSVFVELQDSLDRIWRAPPRTQAGMVVLLRERLLSFGMILGLSFLLVVSLAVSAVIAALSHWWRGAFGEWLMLAQLANLGVGFAITMVVFAMIYKYMPRVRVDWHDVWVGALVTAGLFTIGRFLIGVYLGRSGIASTYGAAGSLIIVLVWIYYSAQIFLLGAEFTCVYAHTVGSQRSGAVAEATVQAIKPPGAAVLAAQPQADIA